MRKFYRVIVVNSKLGQQPPQGCDVKHQHHYTFAWDICQFPNHHKDCAIGLAGAVGTI